MEVALDHTVVGLDRPSVINCDGIHTLAKDTLAEHVGVVPDTVMRQVCHAVSHAIGC